MPTAGRLAGAVIFALFGWYLATITVGFFPEARPPSFWMPLTAGLGIYLGWQVCGKRAGRGYNAATGVGLTVGAALAFCAIFALAFVQMVRNSMRLRYDGPMEAVVDVFRLMIETGESFYDIPLIVTVLVGGMICAWITEFFGQRLP